MVVEQKSGKVFDLQERTFKFAKEVRDFLASLPLNACIDDKQQLIRSSGSVAANYIEANEALGTKDFAMRLKIAHKEAKESILWLRLIKNSESANRSAEIDRLIQEGWELVKIFSAIIQKFKKIDWFLAVLDLGNLKIQEPIHYCGRSTIVMASHGQLYF